jgi:hypothetical protein
MSFLGNIVGSIGDGKAPPPPPEAARKPMNSTALRANSATAKPTSRPTTPVLSSGIKRKADDNATNSAQRPAKPLPSTQTSTAIRRPAAPPLNAPKPSADKATIPKIQTDKLNKAVSSKPSPTAGTSSPKPPPTRGSFADLMARAKAQNSQQKIGVVTHQKAAPKEKLSRRAEQKKAEEDKQRKERSGNGGIRKPDSRRSASPVKNGVKDGRIAKPSTKPSYAGTMGRSTGRDRPRQDKQSRYDSYLGTDEEDNSDLDDDEEGYDDGYESSDMEGGFDDLEQEESQALRQAKVDDARELALENQLKREKDERRKKLMGLAAKRQK